MISPLPASPRDRATPPFPASGEEQHADLWETILQKTGKKLP
jgi:hypothetical protein